MGLSQIDRRIIVSVCLLSIVPMLASWFGWDFGAGFPSLEESTSPKNFDSPASEFWLDWLIVVMFFLAGIGAILHFLVLRKIWVANIGFALFVTGGFEMYLYTSSYTPMGLQSGMLPLNWFASQTFFSASFFAVLAIYLFQSKTNELEGRRAFAPTVTLTSIVSVTAILALIVFVYRSLASREDALPALASFQPLIWIPLLLFVAVFGGYSVHFQRTRLPFSLYIAVGAIPALLAQVHMLASMHLFDHHFYSAYFLQLLVVGIVLIGTMTEMSIHVVEDSELEHDNQDHDKNNRGDSKIGVVEPLTSLSESPLMKLLEDDKLEDDKRGPDQNIEVLPVGVAKFPMSVKLPLAGFGLALAVSGIIGMVYYFESREMVIDNIENEIAIESDLVEPLLAQMYQQASSDSLFLSGTPPIQGLIKSISQEDQVNYDLWEDRLAQIFEQFLNNKGLYTQIRYIGLGEKGQEIVNVVRRNSVARRVPNSRLQSKGTRDYYKNTLGRHPGEVYFSPIELNREWGKIVEPHQAVMRVATPIFDEASGVSFGIVIINIDIQLFFEQLTRVALKKFNFYLANADGAMLYTPSSIVSGLDQDNPEYITDFFPQLHDVVAGKQQREKFDSLMDSSGKLHIAYYRKLSMDQYGSAYPLITLMHHKTDSAIAALHHFRDRSITLGIILSLVALAVALLLSRRLIQPLSQITMSVQDYERTGRLDSLPVHSHEETGVLARTFHNLLVRIRQSADQQAQAIQKSTEASARLMSILNAAAEAIITIDQHGKILSVNIAAKAMFGYAEDELVGHSVNKLMPEEHAQLHDAYVNNNLRSGQNKIIGKGRKLSGKKRDGQEFPIFLTVTRVKNQGEIIFTGMIRDLTAEENAQKALENSNRQLELVIDSLDAGIWDWDIRSNEIKVNARLAEMLGYSLAEMTPCTADDFKASAHKEDYDNAMLLMEQHFKSKAKYHAEIRVRHKNGNWLWVLDAGKVVERDSNGKPLRVLGIRLDISEKKLADSDMQDMQWRMDFALRSSGVGIWEYSFKDNSLVWDERMFELYGRHPSVSAENYELWASALHEDDKERAVADFERSIQNKEDFSSQFRVKWPSGEIRYLEAFGRLLCDEQGNPLRVVGTNRDITSQKHLAQEREYALEKAEESAKMKSEFLASMSHEIRTPMNGVLGMLGLLQRSELNDDQDHHLMLARSSAESLLTIINDILDFSKVEAGKLQLELIDFDLRSQLGEFSASIAHRAEEKNIEIILDTKDVTHQMVTGDPGRLRQILTNLVGNAVKFTHEGEIIVRAATREQHGKMRFDCSVVDTGIGIPRDKINKLFDAFTQVDASTTRQFGGTGLGLAIVKQMCTLMDGDIQVISDEGLGSCFSFYVMFEQCVHTEVEIPKLNAQGAPVLIVDDNATNREVMRCELKRLGAVVQDASSAREALQFLTARADQGEKTFVAAYLDMRMPEEDGESLAKKIRSDNRFDNMKLIMMTSMVRRGDSRHFAELGFSAYFPKPVTSSDIHDSLSIVLNGGDILEQANPLVTSQYIQGLKQLAQSEEIKWPEAARLLLVEDNSINQAVAVGLLEDIGLSCDIAGNGVEAIEALRRGLNSKPYTLVIMDCQMPEMDGYQATREIRKGLAGDGNRAVPIIAMTANAMKGDKEKCLAVGMNDYLSKPIDPAQMEEKMKLWLLGVDHSKEKAVVNKPVRASKTSESYGNESAQKNTSISLEKPSLQQNDESNPLWDRDAALKRVRGKEERLLRLLDIFLEDMPKRVVGMQNALDDSEFSQLADTAHAIKGVAANIGAIVLMQDASDIEKIAKRGAGADLTEKLPEFLYHYKETESLFRGYVRRYNS